ncbi:MAG: HPr family phosphocarrier protein [Candidatus Tokpelaia sp.]|uniref:HPr family phosphocarrier protein n=1 Tax=Candidatus Tokpelaia sp. TaxID=2233777 RepID=UPI00123870CC|nr:HPr family phosphocarrier protein [Candidatus Tokpelaia sp.]KAA6204536.1 MAG: HPr family phosphocarrier protein [Candidatus Tokpelaia sp.]KAA6206877.1 MAG: HPr family phosphocarrier protein [Candidatus Tokpelaia sp.]KAA6404636.1 HPr family phosphocarrier protein [Candidatus Tokpelaia sp.]
MTDKEFSRKLEICNKLGLHARASARFVQAVARFEAEIKVEKDGMQVGGDSIMGLMMLAAAPGSSITIRARGREARQALQALAELVQARFGEES